MCFSSIHMKTLSETQRAADLSCDCARVMMFKRNKEAIWKWFVQKGEGFFFLINIFKKNVEPNSVYRYLHTA